MSLYGQFIFFLVAITLASFVMLSVHALRNRDAMILLPDHDEAQRRLFCCTLCRKRAAASDRDGALLQNESLNVSEVSAEAPPMLVESPFKFSFATTTQSELIFFMGLSNALASILQWYATPPTREPPLLNSVVPCLAVVFSVPLSKFLLSDAKPYTSRAPLLSLLAIALGCIVSLVPSMLSDGALGGDESRGNLFLWTLVNVVSQLPSGGSLVLVQAYLMRADAMAVASGADDAARSTSKLTSVLRFVLYNQLGVAVGLACLWWLDVVPWFGSEDLASLREGVSFAFSCSVGASAPPACAPLVPLFALLGVLPYIVYLSCIAIISADSAVFGNVVLVVQTIVQSAFFLIPKMNPNAAATPVWSTLVSVALCVGGVAAYKLWEAAQGEDAIKVPGYPCVKEARTDYS
jgi:heme exporter protein D